MASRQCEQTLAGNQVVVTYTAYKDYDIGVSYLGRFYGSAATDVGGGVVEYDQVRTFPNGGHEVARVYDSSSRHPFSVSVACGADVGNCLSAIRLIPFLSLDRFDS